jgi:hypothetical protein
MVKPIHDSPYLIHDSTLSKLVIPLNMLLLNSPKPTDGLDALTIGLYLNFRKRWNVEL